MLPAYIPNPVAALFGGGTPVDFGKNYSDGRRVFGNGKTYRGFAAGVLAGIGVGLLEIGLSGSYNLSYLPEHTLTTIIVLSAGALIGDLVKSFFKRRMGKDRGEKWPVADIYDLVAGALLMLLIFDPGWAFANITVPILLVIIILTPILHRSVNIIGYLFRIKEVPW
jgi:CDP-2,3-bis-(O-geranylgeranyl)-sn-glycerol synthase